MLLANRDSFSGTDGDGTSSFSGESVSGFADLPSTHRKTRTEVLAADSVREVYRVAALLRQDILSLSATSIG